MIRRLAFASLLAICAVPAAAQDDTPDDAAARTVLRDFGRCIATSEPSESARVTKLDFTSERYRIALRMLADQSRRECAQWDRREGNRMRSANLLMAGAIAEGLLAIGEEPLNARLVRAANVSTPTFSATDAVAQCLARSLPDQTGALFLAAPASADETTAAAVLLAAVPACSQAANVDARMELSTSALRAMVATAAFRLLASGGDSDD